MGSLVDVLIVGGGVAGLSAASTIVRQDHSVLVLDSQQYRNGGSKHMHTVPTWDHRNPADWRAAAKNDFERYGTVSIEQEEAVKAEQLEDELFKVTAASGKHWKAKKLILATGVEDVLPDIPGYSECWISGIFHCLYCHGWEEKGVSSSGGLAIGESASVPVSLHIARQALRFSKKVTIYTDGNTQLTDDLESALKTSAAPMEIDARKITRVEKSPTRAEVTLYFKDGVSKTEGFLFGKPPTKLRGDLHTQLGLAMTPKGTIVVNPPFNQTSMKGIFAAGDCASPMQTVTTAQASGTNAGAGAPLQLQAEMWEQTPIF
ncbi:FAD/NAD(P)-binding domain-containing protein [Aaosphaeria arxii CBS 175.79]|uniref:FAD/NAD(P)-binding domain-containing protein n=1 Tax=Aaosphaeria arxii CBS 175.79 TaxID=1450172 RepID=A0A6A5XND7_9PLEO|nr:FAD/NAD(P)-binding domain-containing protein [Aaosphaeria arxii CBS 175.79]KAF2014416.1 FAD/NAD(P)-binding domain-containing protein [Aaosphaeria arxii CBS 175.79]